ncbi:helicase-related protein [Cohnella hongkongensis]|uniref:Helicase-related protein n=1 Tax=Cohnella hongkongensis TaxID=178337 RepID=A0ABV9FEU9_9BACL
MRVIVYAVKTEIGRRAAFSIDWGTDCEFWSGRADEIVRLKEEMPLGEAERLCRVLAEEWESEARRLGSKGVKKEPRDIRRASKEKGENPVEHGDWADSLAHHAKLAGYAGEIERMRPREGAVAEPRLLEAARLASARLAGRSLLREEALQLLDAVLPGSSGVRPLAALQLAALQGAVQLAAAVAPDSAAPPTRGLRRWAERLRLARPLRGRGPGTRAQELRCRRCGSADKLRRTDCAACGQACAYCEACLTMGRSRECGLLVIGAPAAGGASAQLTARRLGDRSPSAVPTAPLAEPPIISSVNSPASRPAIPSANSSANSSVNSSASPSAIPSASSSVNSSASPSAIPSASSSVISPASPSAVPTAPLAEPPIISSVISPASRPIRPAAARAAAVRFGGILRRPATPASASQTLSAEAVRRRLIERWGLSPAQSDAAAQALAFLEDPTASRGRSFLLWAVTGAGKTEMIFPLLESVLDRGGRALVATPRRDVVLELAPRLAKAFPDRRLAVLYGGSADRWSSGELTLATTHQLLRYQEAFDLVLIDELDAFPFHNDPMLHYAAAKSGKPDGRTVYLSATPPAALQREAARGRLAYARVPVRYHRYPLPVPRRLKLPSVYEMLGRQTLPARLLRPMRQSVSRGAQLFLFVPYVKQVEPMVHLLRGRAGELGLAATAVAGTSSRDGERGGKVASFRGQSVQLLVTTTILERGVTIPRSDVFILDAHHSLFDAASLVQMAGRAGRSGDDPFGFVFFGAPEWTRSQRSAIRQIQAMNAAAGRGGYLRTDGPPTQV